MRTFLIAVVMLIVGFAIGWFGKEQYAKQECECNQTAPVTAPAKKAEQKPAPKKAVAPAPAKKAELKPKVEVTVNIHGSPSQTVTTFPPATVNVMPTPAPAPAVVADAVCPAGFTVTQFVWAPGALDTKTTVGGKEITARDFIEGLKSQVKSAGQVSDPTSAVFGPAFFARASKGDLVQSSQKYPATMIVERGGVPTREIWKGEVGAGSVTDVTVPDFQVGDTVRVLVSGTLASPWEMKPISFTRTAGMRGCKLAQHAIAK